MVRFLLNSSIGRKVVMSVTGAALVFFILFHMAMNVVAIIEPSAYNWICEMLGANWYALVGTVGLAALVVLHFIYAFILTWQNRKARGNVRYAVTVTEKGVDWSSKNMLVLGIIVILGLALHLSHFWAKMQLVELLGGHEVALGNGSVVKPTEGAAIIAYTFSQWYNVVLYLVWFVALWFHLTHGVWSMFQSAGLANDTWLPRLKCVSKLLATVIFLGFAVVVVVYYVAQACPCVVEACPCLAKLLPTAAETCCEACCGVAPVVEAAPVVEQAVEAAAEVVPAN